MVVNDFECDLFRAGYIQPSTRSNVVEDDDFNSHERGDRWRLLFPEVVQAINNNNNSIGNNGQAESDQEKNINNNVHNQQRDQSNSSYVGRIDESFPLTTIERARRHNRHITFLSDSSTDDIILMDRNLRVKGPHSCTSNMGSPNSNLFGQEQLEHEFESLSSDGSSEFPMNKPCIQVMYKDDDDEKYDPQRIPSSVFERCDSLIPAEWSATSNESLFSLHIGNSSSIGREQPLLLSGELKNHHSGVVFPKPQQDFEVENLQEIRKLAGFAKVGSDDHQVNNVNKTSTMNNVEGKNDCQGKKMDKKVKIETKEEATKVMKQHEEGNKHNQPNIHSSSISLHSNTTEDSNFSFAFPIFGEAERNSLKKGHHHQQQQQQQIDTNNQFAPSTPMAPKTKGFFSIFRVLACNSCTSWSCCQQRFSCSSCVSCTSCFTCSSCFSCTSCCSRVTSCFSCTSCCSRVTSCFSCGSCKTCCGA